ncbi:MAG: protein kinase [Richelia sp. CSU_2_1]|nr:protein kinase [Richelia sp. CSU_2_1]
MQGQTLAGRYCIIKHLGRGGFGQTFLAEDAKRSGNPRCVVKQLKPQYKDPETLQIATRLFKTETDTLHKLGTYPQIPELLDSFEENGEFYLVQEFIEGKDLSKEITPGKKFSEAEVIAILQELLEILVFVQQHKVIHRDIKPSNLMRRDADGKIFLIDFGAVKQITTQSVNSQGQIQRTVPIATQGYASPEQKNGLPNFCSDIYSAGIIGIECLTGISPNQLPTDADCEIVWRDRAQVSDSFANVLDKMVRYHFRDRYQSAVEVLQVLQELTNSFSAPTTVSPSSAFSAPTTVSPSSKLFTLNPTRTRKHIFMAIGLVFAVVFGAAGFFVPGIIKTIESKNDGNFASYENLENRFKISYPDNWDKQEESNPISKEVVQFISPLESNADSFQERLIVTVEPSGDRTLEDYAKLSKQEILKLDLNAKITKEGAFTIARKSGYRIVYTTKMGDRELKKLEALTLKNDKAYLITYEAESGNYEKFLPVVEKAIKSIEIQDTR